MAITVDHTAVGTVLDQSEYEAGSGAAHSVSGEAAQANQAALEAETNEDTYAPPDLLHFGPWAAKVWIHYGTVTSTSIQASQNVTSIADNGTGDTTITIATDFSGVDHAVVGMDSGTTGTISLAIPAAATQQITTHDGTPANADRADIGIAMFGDQ